MQDYFKYDNIQRGAPLFMKSDSNGTTDKQNSKLPLGIKSIPQGIKHFSNWNEMSNSIEANKGIRFDDSQPSSMFFNSRGLGAFYDKWGVNDIKICDDMAFVCYEDYTDVSKQNLAGAEVIYEIFSLRDETSYLYYCYDRFANILQTSTMLKIPTYGLPNTDALSSCIIKLTFPSLITKPGFGLYRPLYKNLYFMYGGSSFNATPFSLPSEVGNYDNVFGGIGIPSFATIGPSSSTVTQDYGFGGEFKVVYQPDYFYEYGATIHDQWIYISLPISILIDLGSFYIGTCNEGVSTQEYRAYIDAISENRVVNRPLNNGFYGACTYSSNIIADVIKIQPYRKCGKVDIYTKKSGIFTSIIDNSCTSPGHGLETNDIIKISSALFDGSQTGAVDIHPLNGEKFVKKIDDNTILLYDDQFFEMPSSTNNLKTSSGITWLCIGSSNGNFAQSWKYKHTLYSPTGKNGYGIVGDDGSSSITTQRPKKISLNQNLSQAFNTPFESDINMSFYPDFIGQVTGKAIKEFLDSIPEDNTQLQNIIYGPHDLYPFFSRSDDDVFNDDGYVVSQYFGNRFGSSIDVKFLRKSGDSKIYLMAIGERGSDISVDLFNVNIDRSDNDKFDPPVASVDATQYSIVSSQPTAIPDNLPCGKIHIYEIVVDKYGRITNTTYKKTIYGDGSSSFINIPFTNIISHNPWAYLSTNLWRIDVASYFDYNSEFFHKWIITSFRETDNGISVGPFDETFYNNTSLYWDRAALTHWFGIKHYDYFNNSTTDNLLSPIKKEYSINRNFILTNGTSGENRSYYGDSGVGLNVTQYRRPDRFNLSGTNAESQWYIFPWVDSFGKSVAIGDITKDGHIPIFGGSSVRSNIELYNPQVSDFSYVLRPVLPSKLHNTNSVFPNGYSLASSSTQSQIGQISCVILDTTTYNPQKLLEINNAGSVDTYNISGDPSQRIIEVGAYQTLSKLRTAKSAGIGHSEVISSCDLSANKIIFKDGLLIWADQILAEGRSIINVLKYNYANDSLVPFSEITNNFTTPRLTDASFVGDGFGMDIKYDNGILVTNCMVTKNNFQEDIGQLLGANVGSFRVDCLKVFDINTSTGYITYIQDIFPAFDKLDTEKYSELLFIEYADQLLDIQTVTYDNDIHGSLTWNTKLINRYDTIDNKILLKDPIEYSLFTPDFSISKNDLNIISESSSNLSPYLYFTEHYKEDSIYYDFSEKTQFIVENTSQWTQLDSFRLGNTRQHRRTPVFFINIPSYAIDSYSTLTINLSLDSSFISNIRSINLDTFTSTILSEIFVAEMPKLLLYKADPRSTIIPNGPSNTNTNNSIVNFTDGLFTSINNVINKNNSNYKIREIYQPLFRGGAADLFQYGNLAGSSPEITPKETFISSTLPDDEDFLRHYFGGSVTLGPLFDATFNQAGNSNKGIISWMSPDNYKYLPNTNLLSNIITYSDILLPDNAISSLNVTFTLPYNIWKDFLIRGNLIKGQSHNRPIFNTSTRIRQGELIDDDPFVGTWDNNFDDINRPSYTATTINSTTILPYYTLAIGFSLEDLDQQTIDQNNYQYSSISSSSYTNNDNLRVMNDILSHRRLTTINNIDISVLGKTLSNVRYKNKFHKVAYFKYNNETYDEIQKTQIDDTFYSQRVRRLSFGKSDFVPLVTGITENSPIIRMGKSNSHSYSNSIDKGGFANSIQILTSESIYNNADISNIYVKGDSDAIYTSIIPTGLLRSAYFTQNNFLGDFDILDTNYLSLTIATKNIDSDQIPLYIKFSMESGVVPISTEGFAQSSNTMPLKIGQKVTNANLPLYVRGPSANFMSLFINETQPSGNITLYTNGPDIDKQLTLTFAPPTSGNIPLVITGPIQNTGIVPLTTRGKTFMLAQQPLYVDGIGVANNNIPLNISGVFTQTGSIPLVMNIPISGTNTLYTHGVFPVNGNLPLFISAKGVETEDATLFIGTQFEVSNNQTTLVIKDTERYIDKAHTIQIKGNINSANNLKNGESNYTLARVRNNLDLSDYAELPVSITFNNETTSSNSLTYKNLIGSQYQKTNTSNITYFGTQARNTKNKNPAFITKQLDTNNNNKTTAFYSDESSNLMIKNNIIKRNGLDANGKNLIAAHTDNNFIAIDIYNIIDNEYLSFSSKIFIGLDRPIPNTDPSQDHLYGRNGILHYPFGDSFVAIRRAIKQYFLPSFTNANLINTDVVVNDLKISNLGKCAISFRAKVNYANNTNNQTKVFNIIILFDIASLRTGVSNISGYTAQKTYYVEEYSYNIIEEFNQLQNKHSAGYNIAFANEDLYFDRRLGQWGQIWKLSKETNYNTPISVIDFGTHPDVEGYVNANNTVYIPENTKKAAFGVPLKIYDENDGSKIMFVGAQLFDPYVFNNLTQPHIPNAIGAVYIYKQSLGSSSWNYFGAVYGKGNTSFNVIANISDYKSSTLDNQEYGLFGYDFDYNGGNLIVSEPGGDGEDPINGGKAYLFKINNTISLLKQYSYSDINTFTTSPIGVEDDYLSSVVLLNPDNPISFSSDINGNSIIQSLHNEAAFVNSLAYIKSNYTTDGQAKNNLNNENKYYDSTLIATINNDLVGRFSTILSLNKLNFGNNNYKLGLIREFYSTIESYGYQQYMNKMSILDINNQPFSLYIAGPSAVINTMPLSIDTFNTTADSATLFIDTFDISSSGLNMIVLNNTAAGQIPLHMASINNNATTLFVNGTFVPTNLTTSLYIDSAPENRLTAYIGGLGAPDNNMNLVVGGNTQPDLKRSATLFIGQEINKNASLSMYSVGAGTFGFSFSDNESSLAISGRAANIADTNDKTTLYIKVPDSAIVNSGSSLYITTDIPPTGDGGGYISATGLNTFIAGNNDAQIFFGKDGGATLSIVSTINVTGIAPLYIERPFGGLMGLYIKNQNPTGVFTTVISGAYIGSGDMSLYISPPTANIVNLITRGFLE